MPAYPQEAAGVLVENLKRPVRKAIIINFRGAALLVFSVGVRLEDGLPKYDARLTSIDGETTPKIRYLAHDLARLDEAHQRMGDETMLLFLSTYGMGTQELEQCRRAAINQMRERVHVVK